MSAATHGAERRQVRVYHQSEPYRFQNSPLGLNAAVSGGYHWIDLDTQSSADEWWENVHWPIVGREGFRYTAASVRAGIPAEKRGRLVESRTSSLPHQVIATLRTRDGYRIRTMGLMLRLAAGKGLSVEVEPKFTPTAVQLDNLAIGARRAYGPDWQKRVIVKRLATIAGWETTLERAHAAGFTTCVLRHGPSVPTYVDQYRP